MSLKYEVVLESVTGRDAKHLLIMFFLLRAIRTGVLKSMPNVLKSKVILKKLLVISSLGSNGFNGFVCLFMLLSTNKFVDRHF